MIPLYVIAVTTAWVTTAAAGGLDSGGLTIGPLASAAGAGAAALGAGLSSREGPAVVVGAVVALPVAVALAAAAHSALPLAACALVVVAGEIARSVRQRAAAPSLLLAAAGVALLGAGLALSLSDLNPGELTVESETAAWLLAGAAGAFLLAFALAPPGRTLSGLLVPPALVTAWLVAPRLEHLALAAAGATTVAAVLSRRPAAALGLAAVAVAAVGPSRPAAALLAAGAVLAVGTRMPAAAVTGLPGAAAFVTVAARMPVSVELAAAAAAVALAALAACRWVRGPVVLDLGGAPAVVLAGWLLLTPGSWAWAGDAPLAGYERSAAAALAAGLLAVVVAWALGQVRPRVEWNSDL